MKKRTILLSTMLVTGCKTREEKKLEEKAAAHHAASTTSVFLWLSVFAILGIGGCVAAAVFLPLKKVWTALAFGFGAVLALSLTVDAVLPYMAWIALALGIVAVGMAVWWFRKYFIANRLAVAFGCDMKKADTNDQAKEVVENHKELQRQFGVKSIIEKTIEEVRGK